MNKIGPIIAIVIIALVVSFGAGVGPGPALAGVGDYIIEANEAKRLLADGGAVLVDMQEAEDFAAGHIAGALLWPRMQPEAGFPAIPHVSMRSFPIWKKCVFSKHVAANGVS